MVNYITCSRESIQLSAPALIPATALTPATPAASDTEPAYQAIMSNKNFKQLHNYITVIL
jgi:hypothetical protein